MTRKQKKKAVENLKALDIYWPYVKDFEKEGIITMFEDGIGFYVNKYNQFPELYKKIQEVESAHNVVVYAVTHEHTSDLEMFTMLFVPNNEADFDASLVACESSLNAEYVAWAFVWTVNGSWGIEEGDVGISREKGGIVRVW